LQAKGRKEKTDAANPIKASEPQQLEIIGTPKPEVVTIRQTSGSLFLYLTQMSEQGQVVYCRYGKDYVTTLAKQ
jgi:hypothetical protein